MGPPGPPGPRTEARREPVGILFPVEEVPAPAARPRPSLRRSLAVSLVAATGAVLIALGLSRAQTGDATVEVRDPAIERQVPGPGDQILRQDRVGVDLAPGYIGEVVLDGVLIPPDQLLVPTDDPAALATDLQWNPLNEFLFQPGPGRVIEELAPGEHRLVVRFWEERLGEDDARTATWTFRVGT